MNNSYKVWEPSDSFPFHISTELSSFPLTKSHADDIVAIQGFIDKNMSAREFLIVLRKKPTEKKFTPVCMKRFNIWYKVTKKQKRNTS